MDLDAYVLAHAHEWRAARAAGAPPAADRRRERRAGRALPAGRHPPLRGPHVGARRALVAHLSSLLARARNRAAGTRVAPGAASGAFFTERFPAALYRLRWWWLGCSPPTSS